MSIRPLKQRLLRFVRSLLTIYLLVGLLGYFFVSDRLIFFPPPSTYRDNPTIIKLTQPDLSRISAMYFKNPNSQKVILFSHGNAEDMGELTDLFHDFTAHGYSLFAYDYSGYGTSEGTPSEQAVYANSVSAYSYLTSTLQIAPDNIIVYGRSLGSGPSVYLATQYKIGGLILESAFVSTFRVKTKWPLFPLDKFNNLRLIGAVNCPVLLLHSADDDFIKLWHAQALQQKIRTANKLVVFEQAGHAGIPFAGEQYWQTIHQFIASINTTKIHLPP